MLFEDSTAAADYNDYDYDTKRDDSGYGSGSGYGGGYDDGIKVLNVQMLQRGKQVYG